MYAVQSLTSVTLILCYQYPQDSQDVLAAAAVFGADSRLEATDVIKLLKSNVILLLFSPSIDLLQSIKSAIDTILDLPRIELADGMPLIVYR